MTLRSYLLRLMALVVLPIMGFAVYLAVAHSDTSRTSQEQEAATIARNTAIALDDQLGGMIALGRTLAQSPLLADAAVTPAFEALARAVQRNQGYEVSLVDAAGRIHMTTAAAEGQGGAAAPSAGGFPVTAALAAALQSRQPLVTTVFLGEPADRQGVEPRFAVIVPLLGSGRTVRAVILAAPVAAIQARVSRNLLPDGWIMRVIDRNGIILARQPFRQGVVGKQSAAPTSHAMQDGRAGAVDLTSAGVPVRDFLVPLAAAPWSVGLAIPLEQLSVAPAQAALQVLVMAVFATLVTVLGGVKVGRRLSESVAAFRQADLGTVAHCGIREIDQVRDALADAAASRQAARAVERKMAALLASSTDGIFELDGAWRFTFLNERARQLMAERRDLVGQTLWEAFPEAAKGTAPEQMRQAMDTQQPAEFELYHAPLGAWLGCRAFPSSAGLVVHVQDVSARKLAELENQRQRELLLKILAVLPVGVMIVDKHGNLAAYNQAAMDIWDGVRGSGGDGFSAYKAWWRSNGKALVPDDWAAARAIRSGETSLKEELDIETFAGTRRSILSSSVPLMGPEGTVEGAVVVHEDISQRIAMEESLRAAKDKAEEILESIDDGFYAVDAEWRFQYVNQRALQMFGLPRQALLGRPLHALFPQTEHSPIKDHFRTALAMRKPHEFETYAPILKRWVAFTVYPSPAGGISVYFRDISAQKQAEQDLKAAKAAAEEANAAKSKFLAAASHDLRQPVQSLMLFTSALSGELEGHPAKPVLGHIDRAITVLKDMLDGLLDISRLDAGVVEVDLQPVSIDGLLRQLSHEYALRAAEKGLRLTVVPNGCWVHSDPRNLERLLRNLVENAIKYTPRGGRILVGCRRRGTLCRIDVIDNGIGIPDDQTEAIFAEFHQLANPERDRTKGLGLGLAIVRRLAGLLGHQVEVASSPGAGSRFSVMATRELAPPRAAEPVAEVPAVGPGGLAVVVEDEEDVRQALRYQLTAWGFSVVAGADLPSILAALPADRSPDVVLVDYQLQGGLLGTEVLDELCETLNRDLPALVITGDTGADHLAGAREAGYRLLHKPVDGRELLNAINEIRAPRQSLREASAAPAE